MAARFLYHLEGNKVALGFVTGLDYSNPYLSPFEEVAALEDPPNVRYYSKTTRVKSPASAWLRRARHQLPAAIDALPKTGVPRWRLGRLQCRLSERWPHQGQPRRHQDRHAGGRGGLSTPLRGAAASTTS